MKTVLLEQLRSRLVNLQGGELILDRASLGQESLSDHWLQLLGTDTLRLANPQLTPADAAGNFGVSGTMRLQELSGLQVSFGFFLSHDTRIPDADAIQCSIDIGNLPPHLTLTTLYRDPPGYLDSDRGAIVLRQSFLRQMVLQSPLLRYSSYDFLEADHANRQNPPARWSTSLPEPLRLDDRLLLRGLNLGADVELDGDFWSQVKQVRRDLARVRLFGAVTLDAGDQPLLQVGHSFADAEGHYPEIDLGIGGAALALKELLLTSGLTPSSQSSPTFSFLAQLGGDELGVELGLQLVTGAGVAVLSARSAGSKPIGIGSIEKAFGLSGLAGHFPLESLGALGLDSVQAHISLASLRLLDVTIGVTTEEPWSIVPDWVEVMPRLLYSADYSGPQKNVSLQISGSWLVGGTHFDVWADPIGKGVGAQMSVGETLDVGALFDMLLPGIGKPDFELLDLDLTGNYEQKTFTFEADAGGAWGFDVGGKPFTLDDFYLLIEYDGAAFSGSVTGTLELAGWFVSVDVEIVDPLSIELTIPNLSISDLLDEFLTLIHLPAELPAFELTDLDVRIVPSTKEFSLSGRSDTPVDLFAGFRFAVDSFSAARDASGKRAQIALTLTFGSTPVQASAVYSLSSGQLSGASDQPPPSEWSFTAALPGADIPLGHVLKALEKLIAYPLPFDDIAVRDFYTSFNLGNAEARRFVIAGALVHGDEKEYGKLSLVARKPFGAADWDYAVSAQLDLDIRLADLPLIGPQLAASEDLTLGALACTFASRAFTAAEMAALLANLPSTAVQPAAKALSKGANFGAQLTLGGDQPIALAVPLDLTRPPAGPLIPPDPRTGFVPPPATDSTKWFGVHKGLGAVTLERIGVRFQNAQLSFLLDAQLAIGPLQIGLAGLGVSSPLDHVAPSFNLDGLSLAYQSGPLAISGGFLRQPDGSYAGQASIELEAFSLSAIGRYTTVDGHPSLFLFAIVDAAIGGPPYFYIRGVAAGLGCNSQLHLPTIAALPNFSLIRAALPGQSPFTAANDPGLVLRQMGADATPSYGSQWLAAGVHYSSFELVQSVALLTVSLGPRFQVALLGLSHVSVPAEASNPIAYAEIAIEAAFDPQKGLISVEGLLTPRSYVLSRACQMTGGFAFYTWFAGEHEGDFVVTLGGYHPRFAVPAHYPKVPRLGLQWQVSGDLAIKGSEYFALTPQALMAGGSLEAVWQSGGVRAWFTADANFLLCWKPFYYLANLGLSIGVSFTIDLLFTSVTISLHVGVDLDLHGPDFGGEAHIDLSLISFTVSFGASSPAQKPISWQEFKSSFLPPVSAQQAPPVPASLLAGAATPTETLCPITVTQGMVRDLTRDDPADGLKWVLHPERFAVATSSMFPSKEAWFNQRSQSGGWTQSFGIAPMGVEAAAFSSGHRVWLERLNGDDQYELYELVAIEPVTKNVPGALWQSQKGAPLPTLEAQPLIENALTGFTIGPRQLEPDSTREIDIEKLQYEWSSPIKRFDWSHPTPVEPAPPNEPSRDTLVIDGQTNREYILSSLVDAATVARRAEVLTALGVEGPLDLARQASTTEMTDWPAVAPLGANLH